MKHFRLLLFYAFVLPLAGQTLIDWNQIRKPPDLPYTDVVQTWTALQNFNAGLTATTGVFSGNVSGASGLFTGNVTGASGLFTAGVSASAAEFPQTVIPNGGYIDFPPLTYPPYNGATCLDSFGNIVTQPLPANGLPAFGANDVVMWNSTSPAMPTNGSCGAPLPVNLDYGLNVNTYFFARGGLATDQPFYNSIQALSRSPGQPGGGVQANTFVASTLYPAGTVTTTGTLVNPANLGGHIDIGHSVGPPAAGTIATVTNPLSGNEGLIAGMEYFDDSLGCLQVYSGTTWLGASAPCISGGGGSPGGANTQVQFNNASTFGGSPNFTWGNSNALLTVLRVNSSSGMQSPLFNANVSGLSGGAKTFQNSDGSWTADYQGNIAAQSLALTNGLTVDTGTYGLTGGGVLTVASCTGCGGAPIYCAGSGTNTITCPGIPAPGSYVNGQAVTLLAGGTNTGATTLNIAMLGPINVLSGGMALSASTLLSGNIYTLYYSTTGPAFNLAPSLGGVTSFNSRTGSVTLLKADVTAVTQALGTTDSPTFAVVNATTMNCTATGSTSCVQQQSGTFIITGAGNIAGQSLALQNGLTVDAGAYGLTAGGALTIASCTGCPGGSASGSNTQVQFNNSGVFGASANFTFNSGSNILTVASGSVASPLFNCTATGASACVQQNSGTFTITGAGNVSAQSLALTNGLTVDTGAYGLNGSGVLTVASCTGCGGSVAGSNTQLQYNNSGVFGASSGLTFNSGTSVLTSTGGMIGTYYNCTATGVTACLQQQSGTFTITGAGNISAQSLALTNGITTGVGTYGLTGGGALTVSSCTGCGIAAGGANTQVQYNNSGAFGGSSNFTYNQGTGILTVGSGSMAAPLFNCTATGGSACIQQNTGTFSITGAGNASFQSVVLTNGVTAPGGISTGSSSTSVLYIGSGGNFYDRPLGVTSGSLSCSGVADGWMAISSDDYVVVCLGAARFRAALASY